METAFWRRFTALCAEQKLTPNGVMLRCGLNTGNPTAWRNGRIPGAATLEVLSGFFACPIEYLLGKTDARSWGEAAPEQKEKAPDGASVDDVKFALFGTTEVSDELYAKVVQMARIAAEMEARQKEG